MRVLHAATMSVPARGVVRQMEEEQRAASAADLPWRAAFFVPRGTAGDVCVDAGMDADDRLTFRRAYYRWLRETVRDYDLLLLRHVQYDPLQVPFMRRLDKPVLLVHHSLEGREILSAGGLAARVRWALESVLGPLAIRRADGLVVMTDEIARYEARRARREPPLVLRYPNGICYDGYAVAEEPLAGADPPELLFVASHFAPWQGLDRLLDALERSGRECVLHVVGEVTPAQRRRLESDSRCRAHGSLDADSLDALVRRVHLGLAAFALERAGFGEACTLKVREYLRAGLPVYSGHRDVFPEGAFFYRLGPCDLDAILDYARHAGARTRAEISSAARPYIDKRELLEELYARLAEHFDR